MLVVLQVGGQWWRFDEPVAVITAVSPTDVLAALQAIETAVTERQLYAAGFMTYEAGGAFGLAVPDRSPDGLPLLCFGLYERPLLGVREALLPLSDKDGAGKYTWVDWQPGVSQAAYEAAIGYIKAAIARGDSYQINYTFPLTNRFQGDSRALFHELARGQRGSYMAYVEMGDYVINSVSPELFFQLDGQQLLSKPMKGTGIRGRTLAEDAVHIAALQASLKDRAENVMIVDMIRNDMGRVATVGSVEVSRLFEVERYPTLLQMTSTVTAKTEVPISQIMAHMFPCASITGAPKVRTMELIRQLEPQPRGIYCGTIGYMGPKRQAQFNVAIRTVVINRATQAAAYHVGSGIVWDSQTVGEYEECQLKAKVLSQKVESFQLLESFLWTPEAGYFLLAEHVNRLMASVAYFGWVVAETAVRNQLSDFATSLTEPVKVRLLLDEWGEITLQAVPLAQHALPEPVRVGLAREVVSDTVIWLYHKTSQRRWYNKARASRPDCDEVILWNQRDEITEASSSNMVLQLDNQLYTPPITSGLLAGTLRHSLLQNNDGSHTPGGLLLQERVLFKDDLRQAKKIWLINSVRGWRTAVLVEGNE